MRRGWTLCIAGALWAAAGVSGIAGKADAQPPAAEYALECSGCHRMDGKGKPGAVPNMRGMIAPMASIERGRKYLVRVPGSRGSPLTDFELAEVLNWMAREFGGAGEGFVPFTAAEVEDYRGKVLNRPMKERAAVIGEMYE